MMMRHPRQQLRGSPNQGISHGVQPLPESALHTVKDPLPARLTRPIHTTLLSPRAADWDRPVPPAFLQSRRRRAVHQDRGCLFASGRVLPPPKMAACRCEMTVSPLVPTEKPDSNLQDGIEEPRGSQEIGGTRFRLGMENCSQRQPHGFEPRTFFESPRTKDHLRERSGSWKEARKREETGRLGGDNCCRENVVGKRVQRTRISSIIPTPTQRSAVLKRVVELAKIHS